MPTTSLRSTPHKLYKCTIRWRNVCRFCSSEVSGCKWIKAKFYSSSFALIAACILEFSVLTNGLRSWSVEGRSPSLPHHTEPEPCARIDPKLWVPFTTFCLLWSYLRATFVAKSLVVMDPPSYNPSQKPSGLWQPAGLSSPRNLRPQFLELRFEFSLAPLQPDRWISNVSSPLFSQLVTIFSYFRLTSLIPPTSLCWNQDYRSGAMKGGSRVAKWLTDELPFLGRSSLKTRRAIPTSARASLYDLWSLGPSTANPT